MDSQDSTRPPQESAKTDHSRWYAILGTIFVLGYFITSLKSMFLPYGEAFDFKIMSSILLPLTLAFSIAATIKKSFKWLAILNLILVPVSWLILLLVGCAYGIGCL